MLVLGRGAHVGHLEVAGALGPGDLFVRGATVDIAKPVKDKEVLVVILSCGKHSHGRDT